MSLADVPSVTSTSAAQPPTELPAPSSRARPTPRPATAGPFSSRWSSAQQQWGLGRDGRQLLAVAFAAAWIACPAIEPLPADDVHYPLWQLPIDIAAIGTIVVAVRALWRGSRRAAQLGVAAGVMMAVETIVCPFAGHTPVGWWTWVQAGLSLFVLFTSAALMARPPRLPA